MVFIKNKKKLIIRSIIISIIIVFLIKLITNKIQWNETIVYSIILVLIPSIYELWQWLKIQNKFYRIAFCIWIFWAFLIIWINGAVGIIGSEDNPANLMYAAVLITWLIGSILSLLKPRGMAYTLFTVSIIQILVPLFALFIWPAKVSWGEAGVLEVLIFNSIFAIIFIISWLFFQLSRLKNNKLNKNDNSNSTWN